MSYTENLKDPTRRQRILARKDKSRLRHAGYPKQGKWTPEKLRELRKAQIQE